MGRMWHTLLLSCWKEVFAWGPVEMRVKERQADYYKVLEKADHDADSTVFIDFMLKTLRNALREIIQGDIINSSPNAVCLSCTLFAPYRG